MIRLSRTTRLGLTGLALTLLAPAVVAQQAKPEELPWDKPKAQPSGQGIMEILPWLIGGDAGKTEKAAPVWNATVGEPADPAEPRVSDPAMAPGVKIETGAIAQSGLVLKSPIPVGRAGLVNAAAQSNAAAHEAQGAAKIQRSVPLPGDRPVEQSAASEVPAATSGETPQESAAEEPPSVAPDAAAPVAPAQLAAPSETPAAANEAAAEVPGAAAVGAPAATDAASPDVHAAPPVEHLPAPASPVRPAFPKAKAVNAAPGTMGLAKQRPDAASPVEHAEQAVAQAAGEPAAEQNAAPSPAAPAVAPEAARAVEAAPTLPVAEEAPPIPDALPDAIVTPVPQPAAVTATEAAPAQAPAASTAEAPAAPTAPLPAAAVNATAVPGVKPPVPTSLSANASVAQQYCFNIADAAKDARYAWQKKTLADIEAELNKRIALLDARTAEYQKWLARRDEFIRNAEENVVKIMSGMRPDAAAVQLTLMNEESAAAVIAKLSSRNASAVLNEMEPAKAAKLTMIITGATKLKRKKELQQKQVPAPTQGAAPAPAGGARADAAQPQGGRS